MKTQKLLLSSLIVAIAIFVMAACSNQDNGEGKNKDNVTEVTIPSYKTGENAAAKFFLSQVERFNEEYEDKYKLTIEETPQDSYGEKIKQLAQQNKLPVIIHGTGSGELDEDWFDKVVVENDLFYDISNWLDENKDIKERMISESIDYNTTEDGEILSLPKVVVQPKVLFYNEKLYSPDKPIRDMSYNDFLNSLNDNKIAFQTDENGWTTGLIWTMLIAEQDGGKSLLNEFGDKTLTDFNDSIIIDSVKELKQVFQEHGTTNSLGAAYADAANSFMSNSASVIPNGPWMTSDFSAESEDKWSNDFKGEDVRADLFPNDIGILTTQVRGDWISNNANEEEKELAEAFFSFVNSPEEIEAYMLSDGGSSPNFEVSEEYTTKIKENQLLYDMDQAVTKNTEYVPNILDIIPSSISDSEFSKLLPDLINEKITAEEFCSKLTEKAQ